MSHVSAKYVCRHGVVEPETDRGVPWCVECECAPYLTDPDVAPLRKTLEAWAPPIASVARDLMAIEVAARRRAEKKLDAERGTVALLREAQRHMLECEDYSLDEGLLARIGAHLGKNGALA